MSFKDKIILPVFLAFGVTLATGVASKFTDGSILNWTGVLTRSVPLVETVYFDSQDFGANGKKYRCSDDRTAIGCFAGSYPGGTNFCGSRIIQENGTGICEVNGCGSGPAGQTWGVSLSCAVK